MALTEQFREKFAAIVKKNDLLNQEITVEVKPLTTEQAIGKPERDDFPLQRGKERILEARFAGAAGQAFTDAFKDYQGDVASLLALDLSDRFNMSIFTAGANAVLRHLGMIGGTIHCRDQEPSRCAQKLIEHTKQAYPNARRVTLVGLQPAMAEQLAKHYELTILDLDPDNIGTEKAGTVVKDGRQYLSAALAGADLVIATGSTLTNHTLEGIRAAAGDKDLLFFGITCAGAAQLMGLDRYCPLGH